MARVFCVGHAVQDFLFAVERLPDRGEKYRARGFETVGGGPAATAAVAIARLGGTPMLAARIGTDTMGDVLIAELERYGVDCSWVHRFADASTSVSSVMVDAAGERMVVNHLDARLPSEPHWLPTVALLDVQAVLGDVRWPEGAERALREAKAAGLPAILDADRPVPTDGSLLAAATHVAFSSEGLADFTGDSDPQRALLAVARQLGNTWCCVTVGEHGCYVAHEGTAEHYPARQVRAVDTLGAGDVWHGAFALALAEGQDESAAVRFASAAAALKVQRRGGRNGAPTREELARFLEDA